MHREEDGPCYYASHAKYNPEDLQVSEEEEAVERGVTENGCIGDLVEGRHPFEPSCGQLLNPFTRHLLVLISCVMESPVRTVVRDSRGMTVGHRLEESGGGEL